LFIPGEARYGLPVIHPVLGSPDNHIGIFEYRYVNVLPSKSYPKILNAKKLPLSIVPICAFVVGLTGGNT
jgi:hypothetical protein